jgi:hypothetical protein
MTLGIKYGHLERARIKSAYRNGTLGFSSYDDYKRHVLDPRVRRTERRLHQLKNGLFNDSQVTPTSLTFSHWLDVKMQQDSDRMMASPAPPPPVFDARTTAAAIMDIADAETRRAELRRVVATLTPAQNAQLQAEVTRIKTDREAATSWIDEV